MPAAPTFTLRQLQLFCAAADHGSFAAAAQALYLTPNAVSTAVRELETALGTDLCVRHRARGLTLTPTGAHMLPKARALLREAEEMHQTLGSVDGTLSGPVGVGCYSTLAATVLPPLMDGFRRTHPGLELGVVDGTVTDLVGRLHDGQLDVVIAYRFGLPADLEHVVLYETEGHVLLPADHRLAAAEAVRLTQVQDEPLILLDLPPSDVHTLEMLSRAGVNPVVAHRTANYELARSLVARGFGYSIMIQKPTIDESYEGRPLVAKRIVPPLPPAAVVVAWPRGARLTERARALVDYARTTVGSQQWTPATPAPRR
ncbi:LysR family transcriptional regulator [Kineococcus sp. LSe6-4]|uniref:LysR family transcriptional regulator n=1 Tax=Kineococcus halophytocola TaxID=3234027 RepID=A0ABV4H4F1_9ACTN